MNITVLRFDELDSTNSEAARQARLGASEGTCIMAACQTAGRGRYGRRWVSEAGAGLYLSIILRPSLEHRRLPLITLMAGVAVHETLTTLGLEPDIKWVNDVLVGEKKIAGILSESAESATGTAVIVGIGINLTSLNFNETLAATATSMEASLGRTIGADQMARGLTANLSNFYDVISRADGPAAILREWARRSTYFRGKRVRVTMNDGSVDGVTDGLDENGALRVITDDGLRVIQAGDVQMLREGGD